MIEIVAAIGVGYFAGSVTMWFFAQRLTKGIKLPESPVVYHKAPVGAAWTELDRTYKTAYQVVLDSKMLYEGNILNEAKQVRQSARRAGKAAVLFVDGVNRG